MRPPEELKHWNHSSWVGIEVTVTKKGHPCRGRKVLVLNVLPKQNTASGLKVEVRFEVFDPSVTNARATFDYDDLLEFKYFFLDNVPLQILTSMI